LEAFNASHDDIKLVLEIVQNDVAYDQLRTEIASGNAPDIVGPVGIRGANEFLGLWLDLQPLVDATGYDLGQYDEATVEFYREDGGLTGIPFAVFPSVIYFNRDLFDEAGLDYPPQAYGEPYADGDPWDWNKVEELAMLLTVDANGNDARRSRYVKLLCEKKRQFRHFFFVYHRFSLDETHKDFFKN
jgi:multiple sugar transport system substrate-binding protein